MFVRYIKIVQLLLLHSIIIQNYVLCDVGSTLTRKNAESEISGENARHTMHQPPKSWSDLSPTIRRLFVNKLESVANEIFGKRLENQFSPLLAKRSNRKLKDQEINIADVLRQSTESMSRSYKENKNESDDSGDPNWLTSSFILWLKRFVWMKRHIGELVG